MDMYVYAPKDDYKHRAYWRELYTVEEAEHLTSLISAAKDQGIIFCYALSPGLDITYSSQKEITTLKRKLEQVSQFGCTCFALLFDDIEPEMSEADKQIFQSFAHAQVSVTNEIHQHLGCPRFLICPTQYCSTRAVPTVTSSEYLNTLGTKLSQQIDIMWTGPKVISKTLTSECIEEITQVLRRPPVIWDNLHANDYDQKRIFLGPYCGRSPELIPLLRGVLTNPNCEYNANMIPIWTLAHWASCSLDAPTHIEAVSWDIKLERESEQGVVDDEAPVPLGKHVYHHRQALRQAIIEWLPEFSIPKAAQGPVTKPQTTITVPPVPIIPIMPSVNTCMSLMTATSNTSTTSTAEPRAISAIPCVNTSQLQAFADVCSCSATPDRPILSTTVTVSPIENFNPVPNPVMNSLVSPTKVILNESIPNPIIPMASSNISLPSEIPVSTLPVPILGIKALEDNGDKADQNMVEKIDETLSNDSVLESTSFIEELKKDKEESDNIIVDEETVDQPRNGDMSIGDTPLTLSPSRAAETEPLDVDPVSATEDATDDVVMNDGMSENGSMQVEPSNSPLSTDMMVEPVETTEATDEPVEIEPVLEPESADPNALTAEDLVLLCDAFYLPFEHGSRGLRLLTDFHWLVTRAANLLPRPHKPQETSEWRRRRSRFAWWTCRARRLTRRIINAPNKELTAELLPYVWELCAVLALLDAVLRWLELGKFPSNVASNLQGTYTWFSKGWREAFESGAQEPWVFRGGLAADLRRLVPVDGAAEALRPLGACALPLTPRPYAPPDEAAVCEVCHKTCRDGSDCSDLFPSDLQSLPADRLVVPFLTLTPELCMVIEEDDDCVHRDGEDDGESPHESEPRVNGIKPQIVGYACAALNSKEFYKKQELAWIPEMCRKYPEELIEREDLSPAAKDCIRHFHQFSSLERAPDSVTRSHPALLTCCVLSAALRDHTASARLLQSVLAALKAHGQCVSVSLAAPQSPALLTCCVLSAALRDHTASARLLQSVLAALKAHGQCVSVSLAAPQSPALLTCCVLSAALRDHTASARLLQSVLAALKAHGQCVSVSLAAPQSPALLTCCVLSAALRDHTASARLLQSVLAALKAHGQCVSVSLAAPQSPALLTCCVLSAALRDHTASARLLQSVLAALKAHGQCVSVSLAAPQSPALLTCCVLSAALRDHTASARLLQSVLAALKAHGQCVSVSLAAPQSPALLTCCVLSAALRDHTASARLLQSVLAALKAHGQCVSVSLAAPQSPALLTCCVLSAALRDHTASARLLQSVLAALKAHGASGVHACINETDMYLHQFYSKLGFVELHRDSGKVYLARAF
ncbi:protein O-GlcNAcase isoform X2 [Amyelois transitella]|nr:protein O-GlcNAcase isoform X2 [Amyelois transitella]